MSRVVDVPSISAIVAAVGVILGVVLTYAELRHQTKIRKIDLIIRLYSRLHSSEFEDAYPKIMALKFENFEDFLKKYGPRHSGKSPEIDRAIGAVCGFFELVGTLLFRKEIDLVLVYDVFGVSMVKEVWEKTKPLTLGYRAERSENENWGVGFEYLYNELVKREPQLKKTLPNASSPLSNSNSSDKSLR